MKQLIIVWLVAFCVVYGCMCYASSGFDAKGNVIAGSGRWLNFLSILIWPFVSA